MTTAEEPPRYRIPARSRRQAMDWGLVLASQGIETVIERSDELGWGLIVLQEEQQRAIAAIDLYQAENRGWGWRSKHFTREFPFDWTSIGWVAFIVAIYWIGERRPAFKEAGTMIGRAVSEGEWWRLFTSIFLHANTAHLASNAAFGFLLLALAMGRFGSGLGILAAFVGGVFGNLVSWWLAPGHNSLGASGMVMAGLGLLAAQSITLWRHGPHNRRLLIGSLGAGVLLFILVGVSPGTDIAAHAGGFVGGLGIGSGLMLLPRTLKSQAVNLIAGLVFCGLTVLVWWLARPHPLPSL